MKINQLLIALTLLCAVCSTCAADNTSQRISGVADFLIDRANDNYLYIFEQKLRNNTDLQCYFPNTFENLKFGTSNSLKSLLVSRDLWKSSIEKDLKFLFLHSVFKQAKSAIETSIDKKASNKSLITLESILKVIGETTSEFDELKGFLESEDIDLCNLIQREKISRQFDLIIKQYNKNNNWVDVLDLYVNFAIPRIWQRACVKLGITDVAAKCESKTSAIKTIDAYFSSNRFAQVAKPLCDKLRIDTVDCRDKTTAMQSIQSRISGYSFSIVAERVCREMGLNESDCSGKRVAKDSILKHLNSYLKERKLYQIATLVESYIAQNGLASKKRLKERFCIQFELDEADCNQYYLENLDKVKDLLPQIKKDITSQVLAELKKIKNHIDQQIARYIEQRKREANAKLDEKIATLQGKVSRFDKLTRHVMFFANISDAENANEVKSILTNYTLPSVSFFAKREEGNHVMVTSYLGVTYNLNEQESVEKANNGIFAPIGVEYSRGIDLLNGNIRSFSVMVSPVDFGYPVNLKLNGIESDFEVDDVIAPSATLAVGFKDYPLTLGVGYQKGREVMDSGVTENRLLLFFAFDMPLLSLHED